MCTEVKRVGGRGCISYAWETFPVHGGNKKSGRADLNRRPRGPKPRALTGLSYAPTLISIADLGQNVKPEHGLEGPVQEDSARAGGAAAAW
jgi:hypothetical protein